MKRLLFAQVILTFIFPLFAEASEPIELSGQGKKVEVPSHEKKELAAKILKVFKLLGDGKNAEKTKEAIIELNTIIELIQSIQTPIMLEQWAIFISKAIKIIQKL